MSILLDTNVCIAALNGRPPAVIEQLAQVLARRTAVAVPSIALFELWYGISKSAKAHSNAEALRVFLEPLQIVDFDHEDARLAGNIRADLGRTGRQIGPYDCLIAAQALRREFLLITANVREFSRVKGLRWENWAN